MAAVDHGGDDDRLTLARSLVRSGIPADEAARFAGVAAEDLTAVLSTRESRAAAAQPAAAEQTRGPLRSAERDPAPSVAAGARAAPGWRAWAAALVSAARRGDWLEVAIRLTWGVVLAAAGFGAGVVVGGWTTAEALMPAGWIHVEVLLRRLPWHLGAFLPLAVAAALLLRGRRWLLAAAQVAVIGAALVLAWNVVR